MHCEQQALFCVCADSLALHMCLLFCHGTAREASVLDKSFQTTQFCHASVACSCPPPTAMIGHSAAVIMLAPVTALLSGVCRKLAMAALQHWISGSLDPVWAPLPHACAFIAGCLLPAHNKLRPASCHLQPGTHACLAYVRCICRNWQAAAPSSTQA